MALLGHICETPPGDSKMWPGLITSATMDLDRCPCVQSRAHGACRKITDTIRGGQRSLEFCPPMAALQPRKVQSDSQEQTKGRWAGRRLAVSSSWNLFL